MILTPRRRKNFSYSVRQAAVDEMTANLAQVRLQGERPRRFFMNKLTIANPRRLLYIFLFGLAGALPLLALLPQASSLAAGFTPTQQNRTATEDDSRNRAISYFKTGEVYQNQGKYLQAAEQYQKAVDEDDNYAEAYSNLGFSYRKQGYYDKAITNYKKAIRLQPDLAEAHEYIGEAYAEMGKFDKAEEHLAILENLHSAEAAELEEFINKQKETP